MADTTPKTYSNDPELYLYTSLTSGSSHIVTATSRMETILKANRIPFKALDIATDEKARMLWGRRAGKDESGRPRKIPGLVQMGLVIGVCFSNVRYGHHLTMTGSR
jgi:SH3-binding, glutamic acid-rich protein